MTLLRNGKPVPTIFDLLGCNENDMTAGLAFVLAASQHFLKGVIGLIAESKIRFPTNATIKIQSTRKGEGITDVEVDCGPDFFAVIEAKQGPLLPSVGQLTCYAPIVKRSNAQRRYLVTVSNATNEFADIHFLSRNVLGVPLRHVSWRSIKRLADAAKRNESNSNKQLLTQFTKYLEGLLGMENKYSNLVYVVSLGQGKPEGWALSWIDIVEKRNQYFYSVGKGWPDPPNYLGFRYGGKLQSIRRVVSYSIFNNPSTVYPEAADVEWGPHYCFDLGPPIVPNRNILSGPRVPRANRCWCMIDALLTCSTISDALTETEKRTHQDS